MPTAVSFDTRMLAPTQATIDLGALKHNARRLQHHAGTADLMAVIKANAYGHGAVEAAQTLTQVGVMHFAVATLPEAIELREAGITADVLIFGAPLVEMLPAYAEYDIGVTISSPHVAEAVVREAQAGHRFRVHVKVDTGMRRIGLEADELADTVALLERTPRVEVASIWTHLATVQDAFVEQQIDYFLDTLQRHGLAERHTHVLNSSALLWKPGLADRFPKRMVRSGIALFGLHKDLDPIADLRLRPVMRLTSRVSHIKTVAAGESVSYDQRWHAPECTRVATVAAGYADGYPRWLTNRGFVGIGGQRYPVAGTVCMDMFMVDLGPAGRPGDTVQVGDEVVLFGLGGPSGMEVAEWAETIPYEICCRVSPRVPRFYEGDSAAE
ncbi:MAG: alanine racemase [Rhodothermales bacterium]